MAGFNFGHKLNNMKVVTILDEKEKDYKAFVPIQTHDKRGTKASNR